MSKKPPNDKAKRKFPNTRQEALLKNLAKGMTKTEAAIAAGYSKKFAGQGAHQALKQIAKTWPERLDKVVGTPESVIEKYIIPLMNAKETKAFNHNGKVVYSKPMEAWGPRYNGLNIYCRIAGAYQEKGEQNAGPVQVIVNCNVKLPDPGMTVTVPSNNGHKPTEDK
jgi:hypothetical protein